MAARTRRTCVVSEGECEAPAGWGISGLGSADGYTSTKTTCYVCGQPACKKCSRIVAWYGKRVRACINCVPEEN